MKKNEYPVSLGQNVPDIVAENFGEQDDIRQFFSDNPSLEIGDFLSAGQKVIVAPRNNAVGNYFKKRGTRVATMNVSAADIIHPYFVLQNKGCCWHFVDCSGFPATETSAYVYEIWNEDETQLLGYAETDNPNYCFIEYYKFVYQQIIIKMTVTNSFGTFQYSLSTYVNLPPIAYQFAVYGWVANFQIMTNSASVIFIDWGDGNVDGPTYYDQTSEHSHTYEFADREKHTVTVYGCRDKIFIDNKV